MAALPGSSLADTLVMLRGERDTILARYGQLNEAISALEVVAGVTAPPKGPGATIAPGPGRPRARGNQPHLNRDDARRAAILIFLAKGPARTGQVAQRLRADPNTTHLALLRLAQAGDIRHVGERAGAKWVLPDWRPPTASTPKEAP